MVRPSIQEAKSKHPKTFETVTELDGGLGENNKTVFTTTWRLDYDGKRVHFLKSKVDNGQQVDVVMQWKARIILKQNALSRMVSGRVNLGG